jgi:hypothetical protein
MEADVFGLVNHTHAASAEFLDDAVVRNSLTDHLESTLSLRGRIGAKIQQINAAVDSVT